MGFLLPLLESLFAQNQTPADDEIHDQVQYPPDVGERRHQVEHSLGDVVRLNEGPDPKHAHGPPLDEERQDKERHVAGGSEVGGQKLGAVPQVEPLGLLVDLDPGEDVQYGVRDEDQDKGHGGEEQVGHITLHAIEVTTAKLN